LKAQYYNLTFRNYSSSQGLSQGEVESVYVDSHGFLWVGSHFGLTRYDGKEYRTYYHHVDDSTTPGDNIVKDIAEDSHGNLWLGLYNSGIAMMHPLTNRFINYMPGPGSLKHARVETIIVDQKDQVWIGTELSLSVFLPLSGKFINISRFPGMEKDLNVLSIAEDDIGIVWIGTKEDGLWRMIPGTWKAEQIAPFQVTQAIWSIRFDKDGQNWLATDHGLLEIQDTYSPVPKVRRAAFYPYREPLKDVEVDPAGNIWMASQLNGLKIYFPKTGFIDELMENFSSARGLLSNRLYDIYQDNRGRIWIGGENGLQHFHDASQRFNIYPGLSNLSDELRGSTLYGIYEINDDILMATSGGVIVYNRVINRYNPVNYFQGYVPGSIRFRSFYREARDVWWVCSDQGVFELIRKDGNYFLKRPAVLRNNPEFRTNSFRNYLKTEDGKYWFATTADGLLKFDPVTNETIFYTDQFHDATGIANNVINNIAYDRDSNLVVCTDSGISILKKGTNYFRNIFPRRSIGSPGLNIPFIYDFYDDGHSYWLATYGGGLNQVNKRDGRITWYTVRNGLCNDGIYTIIPTGDSLLWMGTTNGLSRFHIPSAVFENYSLADGIPADEFNMLSKFVNEEGEIFMGTMNGLISFRPADVNKDTSRPRIYLTAVRLQGGYLSDSATTLVNTDKKLVIKYNQDLLLEFSPMMYRPVSSVSIRYQIKEISNEWKEGEINGQLPLVKIEPGEYTLAVQLFANQNRIGSDVLEIKLVIIPPYWKTTGFTISLLLLGAIAVFLIIRYYIIRRLEMQRVIFEREQAVERERSRISAELHDDIGGGLTAIRLMSEMQKDKTADRDSSFFFNKISASSNELIQKMNEIVWALNINNDNLQSLVSYTRQFAVSYLDDLKISSEVVFPEQIPDIPVPGSHRRSVFLLVKECLNNVAKHAQASHVYIEIKIRDNFHIEIRDNGKGFDQLKTREGSHGLTNMSRRVKALKGKMQILIRNGTAVIFDIPLDQLSAHATT
jgi:signal transduction histidine kinase/ligand-binding sensor domain-containing protein